MRTQRLVRQLKSVAVLGTALVCLVLFASSLLGEGGVGVSGRDGASEGANTAKARIQETLGLFGNGFDPWSAPGCADGAGSSGPAPASAACCA